MPEERPWEDWWYIEKLVGKGKRAEWKMLAHIHGRQIAEQVWQRYYYGEGRLISHDGKIKMSVPGAGSKEVEKD